MATGKCVNITKPCSKALNREEIEADKVNFVCPECGKPLVEIQGNSKKKKEKDDEGGGINWKLISIIAAAIVVLCGIGFGVYSFIGGNDITAVKLDKKSLKLEVGQRELLTASVEPKDAKATYVWKSSDKTVVSVVGGEITALRKGNATITVKVEEKSELRGATCKIVVEQKDKTPNPDDGKDGKSQTEPQHQEQLISNLSIDGGNFSLKVGDSKQLAYKAEPQENDENLSWASSDTKVATVSETGEVKAVGEGTSTITATSDKSNKQASVTVTVTKKDGGTGGGNGGAQPSWGRYEGPRNSSGKPNGNGVLYITRSHTINGQTAQPGETIKGVFRDGYVNMGTWFKKDGNAVVVKDLKVL